MPQWYRYECIYAVVLSSTFRMPYPRKHTPMHTHTHTRPHMGAVSGRRYVAHCTAQAGHSLQSGKNGKKGDGGPVQSDVRPPCELVGHKCCLLSHAIRTPQRHRLGLSVCRVKQKLEPSEKRSAILRCFPPLGDTMLSSPQLPLFIFLRDQKRWPE